MTLQNKVATAAPRSSAERIALLRNGAGMFLLGAAISVSPVLGSTDPAAIAAWCVVLGLAACCVDLSRFRRPHFLILGAISIIVAANAFVLHEQLASHSWLAAVYPLWPQTADVLPQATAATVIARNQPLFSIGDAAIPMLALLVSFAFATDRDRARTIIQIVAVSGAVYAVIGLAQFAIDSRFVLWREKIAHITDLTGPFLNRNTAADYFGMAAILWLLSILKIFRPRTSSRKSRWLRAYETLPKQSQQSAIVRSVILVVCVAALFMTNSRAGVILSMLAAIVAVVMYFRSRGRRQRLLTILTPVGAMAALAFIVFGSGVGGRFDIIGLAGEGRLETAQSVWRMIVDRPWFGAGIGTFVWAYPQYRSDGAGITGVWDRAHNTLLEIAATAGAPYAILLAAAWVAAAFILLRATKVRSRDLEFPVMGLAVVLLAGLHSFVDFSLQIPGFAIPAMSVIGVGLAQSFSRGDRRDQRKPPQPTNSTQRG